MHPDEQVVHAVLAGNRDDVWDAYLASKGNISETCRVLASKGISTTRKTLRKYIGAWGFPDRDELRKEAS